jgi:hypothetical protein
VTAERPIGLALLAALAFAGCGDGSSATDGAPSDGGHDLAAPVDLGPPDLTPPQDLAGFPAFHPTMPQVRSEGGAIMPTVRIQPVFFPGDALEAKAVDFLNKLAGSAEWPKLVGEYGVGAASVAPAIDLPAAPPAQVTEADVDALLADRLDGTHPEWEPSGGATLDTTVYVLFYPAATAITGPGGVASCTDFDGYHYSANLPSDGGVRAAAYVLMARCPTGNDLDQLTEILSHELAEAATDPFPTVKAAYRTLDPRQMGWALAFGGPEIGDLCQGNSFNYFSPGDIGYSIQRSFSNARAAAWDEMCSPKQDVGPGFYTAPTVVEDVTLQSGAVVDGINVPLGGSRTIELGLLSAGPTAGDWQVDVYDWLAYHFGEAAALGLSLDANMGHNGDVVHLTIKATRRPSLGAAILVIRSLLNNQKSEWVVMIGVN